jgi:nucleotide-binding universal stress UspA family protein
LSAAFEAASLRKATLTLMCAWRPEGPYSTLVEGPGRAEAWVRNAQRHLAALSTAARAEYPAVQVTTAAEYELTATALTDATRTADLMLIGRTGHRAPAGLMLGSITHTLLRTATCPLEIVPT